MYRKRLFLAITTLLLLGGIWGGATPSRALTRDNLNHALLATVKIWSLGPDNKPFAGCSGTTLDDAGYILTNWHCVGHSDLYGPDDTGLGLKNGDTYNPQGLVVIGPTMDPRQAPTPTYIAQLVTGDPMRDVAVVKVVRMFDEKQQLPAHLPLVPITLGDSDQVQDLDYVAVIGYPGLGGATVTVTDGKISGFDSQTGQGANDSFKTTASINHGNSGGLAVNDNGEQIGIPTWGQEQGAGKIDRIKMINIAVPVIEQARKLGGAQGGPPQQVATNPANPPTQTAPSGNTNFGTPIFAAGVQNGKLVDPGNQIPSGATQVLGVWDYAGMRKKADWGFVFSYNNQAIEGQDHGLSWTLSDKGRAQVSLKSQDGSALPDGPYTLTLYSGGTAAAQGAFTIGSGTPTLPGKTPPPPQTRGGVTFQGQVLDADTQRGIESALIVVLKPGVTVAQWEAKNFAEDMVVSSGTTDAQGSYLTAPAFATGQTYTVVVGAKGYQRVDGTINVATTDTGVVSIDPITLQAQ